VFVQFAELPVFDQDRAKRFYVDHFHCQVVADVPMNKDGWRWLELKFPGAETALHFLRRPDETPSKDPVLVFVAEDVEATVQELASNGVTIVTKPGPAPYNPRKTVAMIEDSESNRIVISSR
jgi:predicted enzyme related to lactoylglutathione lyase